MVEILNKYGGGVRAGKAIMKIIGIDCGPSRAPVKIFSSSEINSLISDLQSVGFIQFSKYNFSGKTSTNQKFLIIQNHLTL